MILVIKFDKFYTHSFYYFISVYVVELLLACSLYFYLPDVIPVHIGLSSADAYDKEKWLVLFVPCLMTLVSYIFKPEFVEKRYPLGPTISAYIKLILFLVQLLGVVKSIQYFYILILLAFN